MVIILFLAAFSSMVEGKNEELSTAELSGGARIHYIFQSIFVKSLEVIIISSFATFRYSLFSSKIPVWIAQLDGVDF